MLHTHPAILPKPISQSNKLTHPANCTGGGTNFPRLKPPTTPADEEKWCKYIDCDRPIEDGVTFKPITGNAIFWRNLKGSEEVERGHRGTLHAGLPVTSGTKMGLNIFTVS